MAAENRYEIEKVGEKFSSLCKSDTTMTWVTCGGKYMISPHWRQQHNQSQQERYYQAFEKNFSPSNWGIKCPSFVNTKGKLTHFIFIPLIRHLVLNQILFYITVSCKLWCQWDEIGLSRTHKNHHFSTALKFTSWSRLWKGLCLVLPSAEMHAGQRKWGNQTDMICQVSELEKNRSLMKILTRYSHEQPLTSNPSHALWGAT